MRAPTTLTAFIIAIALAACSASRALREDVHDLGTADVDGHQEERPSNAVLLAAGGRPPPKPPPPRRAPDQAAQPTPPAPRPPAQAPQPSPTASREAEQVPNRIYSARELVKRAAEPGPFHNFPESFNKQIFEQGTRTITPSFWRKAKPGLSNDAVMYQLRGTLNGVAGTFEIGVRPSASGSTEVIEHRFFRPDP